MRSRADVKAEVLVSRSSGDLDILREYDVADGYDELTLARAEVIADMLVWRRAGMAAFGRGEASPDTFSPEFRNARARYAAMRASPEFAALVQAIARRRGEIVLIARPPEAR
jgi:hypothetical protein